MAMLDPYLLALLPGPQELWIILIIALVLFGGSRIPTMMRGMGKGISEFKKGLKDTGDDEDESAPKPPAPTQTGT